MGNTCSSDAKKKKGASQTSIKEAQPKKELTFGRDPNLNPADFIISGKTGETIVREPGSINGQQFIVEECTDCNIYLLDHSATVSVDHCENCRIFIGPCESSVFIRNVKKSDLIVAAQQFRTRDCRDLNVLLYCSTEPILEATSNMRVGCFDYSYFNLREQMVSAKLSVWDNKWSDFHNFTPDKGDWQCIAESSTAQDMLPALPAEVAERVGYTIDPASFVIPRSEGLKRRDEGHTGFVCFLPGHHEQAVNLITSILSGEGQNRPQLVQSKELALTKAMAKTLFGGNSTLQAAAVGKGGSPRCMGMEWKGADCGAVIQAAITALQLPPSSVYVCPDVESAGVAVKNFFELWKEEV